MKFVTDPSEIVVLGSKGTALAALRNLNLVRKTRFLAFIDDFDNGFAHPTTGAPVISRDTWRRDYFDVPILLMSSRLGQCRQIAEDLGREGATFATICGAPWNVDPTAEIADGAHMSSRCIVGAYTKIGPFARIWGKVISHDCVIGAHTHITAQVQLAGHVHVGEGVHIGQGAIISNGTPDRPLMIGDGAVIGTGAVVHRDVPAGQTVLGNPAMPKRDWVRLMRMARGD